MTVRIGSATLILWVALAFLSNGCLAPPFIFPRTGASGSVIDQNGHPLTNAQVKVDWSTWRFFYWWQPRDTAEVPIKDDGTWAFSRRKVDYMTIDVLAPQGYEPWKRGIEVLGNRYLTNVVCQFQKIPTNQPPKESK